MSSDPLLYWVGLSSLLLVLLALLILFSTLWVRQNRLKTAAQREQVHSRWRPILFERAVDAESKAALPTLAQQELPFFVELWLALYQTLRGPARDRLTAVAEQLELNAQLRYWLLAANPDLRLSAMILLGYLKDEQAYPLIEKQLRSGDTASSLCAARALISLNTATGLQAILPSMVRSDWSIGRIAGLLEDIDPEVRQALLAESLGTADAQQSVRILRALRILAPSGHTPAIRVALANQGDDADVLCACLAAMTHPHWLDTVRTLRQHDSWPVRVQAVQALGRIGSATDLPLLLESLTDSVWWVRMRAARACLQLTGISRAALKAQSLNLSDRYARDALADALQTEVEPYR